FTLASAFTSTRIHSRLHRRLALLLSVFLLTACHHAISPPNTRQASSKPSAIRLNNLGVARLNQGRGVEALESFRQAEQLDSGLFAARLNEGIALLNTQRFDEARDVLLDATRRQPDNPRAWYNLGILYR